MPGEGEKRGRRGKALDVPRGSRAGPSIQPRKTGYGGCAAQAGFGESGENIGKIRPGLKSGLECRFRIYSAHSTFIHSFSKYVLKACLRLWTRHRGRPRGLCDGPCTSGAQTVPTPGTRIDKNGPPRLLPPSQDPGSPVSICPTSILPRPLGLRAGFSSAPYSACPCAPPPQPHCGHLPGRSHQPPRGSATK